MTKRSISLGGTNWANGEVLYAADLNDTTNAGNNDIAVDLIRTIFTKTTSYTQEEDLSVTTYMDTTNTTALSIWNPLNDANPIGKIYPIGVEVNMIDNFEDNSLSAVIWDIVQPPGAGEITETLGKLNIRIRQIETGSITTTSEVFSTSNRIDFRETKGSATIVGKVQIVDASAHVVDIVIFANGSTAYYTIKKDGTNVYVSTNGGAFGGAIDCSSVTGTWLLRFTATGTSAAIDETLSLDFVSEGNMGACNYYSLKLNTTTDTIYECLLTSDETLTTTTATYYATADGTNWEAITLNQRHKFTNTGTDLRFKITFSTTDATLLLPNINSYIDWFGFSYWYS